MEHQQYTESDGVFDNINIEGHKYHKNFIERAQDEFMTKQANEHQLDTTIENIQCSRIRLGVYSDLGVKNGEL